jgi:hypothetical protein
VPTGPVVRPGRKRKGSANDTPTNKKPLLGAVNTDALEDDIEIPRGTLVTRVAGIEMPSEDVGAAIQFLEFFRLFGKVVMENTQYRHFIIFIQSRSSVVGEADNLCRFLTTCLVSIK